MTYIARIDGQPGAYAVVELREGVLSQISARDPNAANWRTVTEVYPGVSWGQATLPSVPQVSDDGSAVTITYIGTPLPPVFLKLRLKAYADQACRKKINGGFVLPNGAGGDTIGTDDHSLIMLVFSLLAFQSGAFTAPIQVPTVSGWATMQLADIQSMFSFIATKGQSVYTAWKAIYDQIDSGAMTDASQIDAALAAI